MNNMLDVTHAPVPVQMNRQQRRDAARNAKRKPRKYNDKTALNPVIVAALEADFRERFSALKRDADQQTIASDDPDKVVFTAGFLLFVTLRALELDGFVIQEREVVEALAIMGAALGDIRMTAKVDSDARQALLTGMDYLDALVQALSKEALALAWAHVDAACSSGGAGTQDLECLLVKLMN